MFWVGGWLGETNMAPSVLHSPDALGENVGGGGCCGLHYKEQGPWIRAIHTCGLVLLANLNGFDYPCGKT